MSRGKVKKGFAERSSDGGCVCIDRGKLNMGSGGGDWSLAVGKGGASVGSSMMVLCSIDCRPQHQKTKSRKGRVISHCHCCQDSSME